MSGGSAAIRFRMSSRIVACLRQNTPQLSNSCRAVFESSAEQQQANRAAGAACRSRPRHAAARRNRCSRRPCSRDRTMRMTNRPAFPRGPDFADIDPFGRGQFRHAHRRDAHRAVGRARRRHHDVERLQRDIAIDRQRRLQSERADAADFMAGDLGDFVEAEHFRLSPEQRLHLLVVHPRGAGGHDQHHALADPQAQRLGDPRRLDAIGFGGKRHGGRTHGGFDHGDVGRLLGEEGADGFKTHVQDLIGQPPDRAVRRGAWMR